MKSAKNFKLITRQVKWLLFVLFLVIFISCYLGIIIRLNLSLNLSRQTQGIFSCVFSQFSVIKPSGEMNWGKCLLICFLCFFPSKLVSDLLINYLRSYIQQAIKTNLSQKVLLNCYKNEEKVQQYHNTIRKIIFETIPTFANQFSDLFFRFWKFLIGLGFELYSLFFRLKVSNSPPEIKWVVIEFLLAVLFNYLIFILITNKLEKANQRKKEKSQLLAKQKISQFLNNPQKVGKLFHFLKENQRQSNLSSLHTAFSQLANLMVPGLSVGFIFFYYQAISQDFSGNIWTIFFTAWNIQRIFLHFRSLILLKPSLFQKKSLQIKNLGKVLS